MINKIICSYILFACLLAVALKIGGVDGTIHLGNYFRSFLVNCNRELLDYHIEIPDIPEIPDMIFVAVRDNTDLFGWFIDFVTGIFSFVNGLVRFLNIIILFVNTLIETIELIFIFLKNIIIMKDEIINA